MKVEEAYVSFEVAKLLKEKGFNGFCERFYDYYPETGEVHICGCDEHDNSRYDDEFSMPTQQMAMRWLREVHTMGITIGAANTYNEGVGYYWHITDNHPGVKWLSGLTYCKTYEEAAEAAIKYCLENLIKND